MKTPHYLIVGGTRGIGRALTRLLDERGYGLTVVARRVPETIETRAAYVAADLAEPHDVVGKVRENIRKQGPLSGMVFLQRFRGRGDAWDGEVQTSLTATKVLIDNLVSSFDPEVPGAIVLVGSNAGRYIARDQPLGYHVAKAGLVQMTRYYAALLGKNNIRVNAVSPGTILKDESRRLYEENGKLLDLYRKITPLGRMGTAAEVAKVIAFLCGPDASFVTGQELRVDGGMSLALHDSLARNLATEPT